MSTLTQPRKRLFVAILLPTDAQADLDEYVDGLRTAHSELRWVPPAHWHVTLEFLSDCGPHETERQIERWTERAQRCGPIQLALAAGGAFPHTWRARVLWAGLSGDLSMWSRLAGNGQQPHVTLARSRQVADLTGPVDGLSAYTGPSWIVDHVALVESHLRRGAGDRGPRYEPLELLALGRPT